MNTCPAQCSAPSEPKIRVAGLSNVSVDPVATIADLTVLGAKFARIVETDLPGSALTLSTAVGDLIASVQQGDTREGFADEVADTLIATFVTANKIGLTAEDICRAVQERLREQAGKAIASSVTQMLAARGLH